MAIQQSVENVTPDTARKWLGTQEKNRKPVAAHVAFLKSVMEREAWGVAQPIIFDSKGHLIDGQHRMLAVIEHGAPVKFAVMRGVEPSLWSALDTGRGRKGSDVLSAEGRTQASLLAATLRLVWQDEIGVLGSAAPEARPTNADILDRDLEHPEIGREVLNAVGVNKYARVAPIAFLYWRTFRANRVVAEAFWSGVLTGEGLKRGTPPYLLHSLLIDQRTGRRRLAAVELLAYAIKAWNAALIEDPPQVLRWARGTEDFPPICATRSEAAHAQENARRQRRMRQAALATA